MTRNGVYASYVAFVMVKFKHAVIKYSLLSWLTYTCRMYVYV